MIRITVYAGPPNVTDQREASTEVHWCDSTEVHDLLRQIGLEWKTADYFMTRPVVITVDVIADNDLPDLKALVRSAAESLERTGLL